MRQDANQRRIVVISFDEFAVRLMRQLKLEAQTLLANDLSDWSKLVNDHFGAIGILELAITDDSKNRKRLSHRIKIAHQTGQNCPNSRIFAAGPNELCRFERELLISGFTAVFCSNSETARCESFFTRHWDSLDWPATSFEYRTKSGLPWKNSAGNS